MDLGEVRTASSCSTAPSGCALLRGVSLLLRDGPAVGVHFLCVDTDTARLPVEAGAVVHVQPGHPSRLTVEISAAAAVKDVVPDAVSDRWAHRFARALAPLRDATPDAGGPQVPDRARLLDVLAPEGLTPEDVAGRLARQPRSTSALLGVAAAGPYTVDLRRDGPHALVGGHDRRGQVRAAADARRLAWRWGTRPDAMVFVLVDYKGGAAFKECAPAAAHRRPRHRPRRPSHGAGPGLARGRAQAARAPPGRRRRQGHRGLLGTAGAADARYRAWSS